MPGTVFRRFAQDLRMHLPERLLDFSETQGFGPPANDCKPVGAELFLSRRSLPAVGPPPFWLMRLDPLSPFFPASVQDHPNIPVARELLPQIIAEGQLVSSHHDEPRIHFSPPTCILWTRSPWQAEVSRGGRKRNLPKGVRPGTLLLE